MALGALEVKFYVSPPIPWNEFVVRKTSAMAKELDVVHQEADEREAQMAALTKALSEAGVGLR